MFFLLSQKSGGDSGKERNSVSEIQLLESFEYFSFIRDLKMSGVNAEISKINKILPPSKRISGALEDLFNNISNLALLEDDFFDDDIKVKELIVSLIKILRLVLPILRKFLVETKDNLVYLKNIYKSNYENFKFSMIFLSENDRVSTFNKNFQDNMILFLSRLGKALEIFLVCFLKMADGGIIDKIKEWVKDFSKFTLFDIFKFFFSLDIFFFFTFLTFPIDAGLMNHLFLQKENKEEGLYSDIEVYFAFRSDDNGTKYIGIPNRFFKFANAFGDICVKNLVFKKKINFAEFYGKISILGKKEKIEKILKIMQSFIGEVNSEEMEKCFTQMELLGKLGVRLIDILTDFIRNSCK